MKITVTPVCTHPDGYSNSGATMRGRGIVVNRDGVWLDGQPAIARDRRPVKDREAGHPWLVVTQRGQTRPLDNAKHVREATPTRFIDTWTGFRVTVEP